MDPFIPKCDLLFGCQAKMSEWATGKEAFSNKAPSIPRFNVTLFPATRVS